MIASQTQLITLIVVIIAASIIIITTVVLLTIFLPKNSNSLNVSAAAISLNVTFDQPVFLTFNINEGASHPNSVYVVEEKGKIYHLDIQTKQKQIWFDMTSDVNASGFEQGLFCIAFEKNTSRFYVIFTNDVNQIVIRRYTHVNGDHEDLISIDNPSLLHNGGCLSFGPDDFLYISIGDTDPTGDTNLNAQSLESLRGKLLRIDVSPSKGYIIPPDNPYVQSSSAKKEIYALGLRNPWRFSIATNGHVWIGDVGAGKFEEINIVTEPAQNFLWPCQEAGETFQICDPFPVNGTAPFYFSIHNAPAAIVGGYVYRGVVEEFKNLYFFADFLTGAVSVIEIGDSKKTKKIIQLQGISSFGENFNGDLFVCEFSSGEIYSIHTNTNY